MVTAARVLDVARRELGFREGPRNDNKYGRAYGVNHVAWCMQFCWWVFGEAGAGDLIHPKTAYTPTAYDWHASRGQVDTTPRPGSLVFYDWPPSSRIQHVGIVEAVEPGSIVTIEGNTQSGDAGDQSDGGGVWRRRRARNSSIVGYGHPAYGASGAVGRAMLRRGDSGPAVAELQQAVGATPDGRFGPNTEAAVRRFQQAHGLTVDGIAGPATWAAIGRPAASAPRRDDDMGLTPAQATQLSEIHTQLLAGWPSWEGGTGETFTPVDYLRRNNTEVAALHRNLNDGVHRKLDQVSAALDKLAEALARPAGNTGPGLTAAEIKQAVTDAIAESLVQVDVRVTGPT